MAQFNFTTNIEKRMPNTGKVFCVDRMTSDYADQHPLDVDGFIESVYQEFAGTEFEESRETLKKLWVDVLSDTNPRGDASLYPNKNGQHRAAAMKVWHKAGDYWRRGLRLGDTLPDMVPMTKITRLEDGSWIALFPKDMGLLEGVEEEEALATTPAGRTEEATTDSNIEPVRNQSEPQQLDLFAFQQLQQENERLRQQLSQAQEQPRPRRQRKPRVEHQQPVVSVAVPQQPIDTNLLKAIGMVAAATVALFVIYETGLLIPLGLIGLATGGLLK